MEVTKYLQVIERLLKEGYIEKLSDENIGYSSNNQANELVFNNEFAFILGLIFDQSIKSSLAWEAPYLLQQRLNGLDIVKICNMEVNHLENIIKEKKSLHRYPSNIAKYVINTSKILVSDFSSQPKKIWDNNSVKNTKTNFLKLSGIGDKKANLAIILLARDFHIKFEDMETLPLALDVHLNRILNRSGIFETKTKEGKTRLNSEFQNYFKSDVFQTSTILWNIGRNFCNEKKPNCMFCPLTNVCLKELM